MGFRNKSKDAGPIEESGSFKNAGPIAHLEFEQHNKRLTNRRARIRVRIIAKGEGLQTLEKGASAMRES